MRIRSLLYPASPYADFSTAGAELDLQGWHSSDPIFGRLIAEVRPQTIVEVGTWKGASAINMAAVAKQAGLTPEIVCVDTWLGALEFWTKHDDPTRYGSLKIRHGFPGVYYTFLTNVALSGHDDVITPFPQTSVNGARWFSLQGIQADLIYIDGSHEETDVLADLAAYWPVLKPGGVIFGDDFSPAAWPSVVRAVKAFAAGLNLKLEEDNEFWILRKSVESPLESPPRSLAATTRPALAVHGTAGTPDVLASFLSQLGYSGATARAAAAGVATWIESGKALPDGQATGEAESLFWVEFPVHGSGLESWSHDWRRRLEIAGGADHVVVLHPYLPLRRQREACGRLCRRLGIDLAELSMDDALLPSRPRVTRPDPADAALVELLDTFNALQIPAHEFCDFPVLTKLEACAPRLRLECAEGGSFEGYSPTHFMIHPPEPGRGWTRAVLGELDWSGARYLSVALSLPSAKAPDVRFQWVILGPRGEPLQVVETVLGARQTKQWLIPLPEGVPPGSLAVLSTQVAKGATHAFAWATWRDPLTFA